MRPALALVLLLLLVPLAGCLGPGASVEPGGSGAAGDEGAGDAAAGAEAWTPPTYEHDFPEDATVTYEERFVVPEGVAGTLVVRVKAADASEVVQLMRAPRELTVTHAGQGSNASCSSQESGAPVFIQVSPPEDEGCVMHSYPATGEWTLTYSGRGGFTARTVVAIE